MAEYITAENMLAGYITAGSSMAGHIIAGYLTAGHFTAGHITVGYTTAGYNKKDILWQGILQNLGNRNGHISTCATEITVD